MSSNPAIPPAELDRLAAAWAEAARLAGEGDPRPGYDLLLGGLERAREFRRGGAGWGSALATRWREAAELFAERHHLT